MAENVDVHLYNFFRTSLYSADSNCQKSYRQSKKKRFGMNKFVRTKSHRESKFYKISLGLLYT